MTTFGAARIGWFSGGAGAPAAQPIEFIGIKTAYVGAANTSHTGTSFAVATSGPNRKLLIGGAIEVASPVSITPSYNGVGATSAINVADAPNFVQLSYIDDTNLPTDGAMHAFSATVSPSSTFRMNAAEYRGMAQGAPSATDTDVGANPSTCTVTVPSGGSGGIMVSLITSGAIGTWDPTAPAVERFELAGSPATATFPVSLADKIAVTGSQDIIQTGSSAPGATRAHVAAAWGEGTT